MKNNSLKVKLLSQETFDDVEILFQIDMETNVTAVGLDIRFKISHNYCHG